MIKNHKNKESKNKKNISIPATVHKSIAQFCLDYGYKQYQVVTEGFHLLKIQKQKKSPHKNTIKGATS